MAQVRISLLFHSGGNTSRTSSRLPLHVFDTGSIIYCSNSMTLPKRRCWATLSLLLSFMMLVSLPSATDAFVPSVVSSQPFFSTSLQMSLKPAAVPLMDSGKALARSGELLIELTSELNLYGGALSASGALIRNSGDALAQAAALCRFKTGAELACDEIREAATCLTEASDKLKAAIQEASTDQDEDLVQKLRPMVETMTTAGVNLEAAGAAIMRRSTGSEIGGYLIICGKQLEISSNQILQLSTDGSNGQISSQRMAYAAQKMMEAGTELIGTPKQKPTGKGWLKG